MKKTKKWMSYLLAASLLLGACSKKIELQLKQEEIIVELGDAVSADPKDYLAEETSVEILEKVIFADDDDLSYMADSETKTFKSADMDYLNVGEYEFKLQYDENTFVIVKVTVQDSVAPEFVDFSETVTFTEGDEVDLTEIFEAEDKSKVEITVEGEVDFSKAGEYPVTFIATDESGNETKKDCTIKVEAKEAAVAPSTGNTGSNESTGSSGSTKPSSKGNSSGSSSGNTPTQPSQSEQPTQPVAHTHVWVDDWGNQAPFPELVFASEQDALNKADDIYQHSDREEYQKYDTNGYWQNLSVRRVICPVCGTEHYAIFLEY